MSRHVNLKTYLPFGDFAKGLKETFLFLTDKNQNFICSNLDCGLNHIVIERGQHSNFSSMLDFLQCKASKQCSSSENITFAIKSPFAALGPTKTSVLVRPLLPAAAAEKGCFCCYVTAAATKPASRTCVSRKKKEMTFLGDYISSTELWPYSLLGLEISGYPSKGWGGVFSPYTSNTFSLGTAMWPLAKKSKKEGRRAEQSLRAFASLSFCNC